MGTGGDAGSHRLELRPLAAAPMLHDVPPGIKIAVQLGADPSDEDLQFVNQLGVEYVTIWLHADLSTYENFTRLRRKVEGAGLKVWNIGNLNVHNMEEVTLNLPGREQKIEEYKTYLRTLGKAGISYTTFAYMGNGIWSSARETTRGWSLRPRLRPGQGSRRLLGSKGLSRASHPWPRLFRAGNLGQLHLLHQGGGPGGGRGGSENRHSSG